MTEKEKRGRGGKQPGAGRPSVRLSEEQRDAIYLAYCRVLQEADHHSLSNAFRRSSRSRKLPWLQRKQESFIAKRKAFAEELQAALQHIVAGDTPEERRARLAAWKSTSGGKWAALFSERALEERGKEIDAMLRPHVSRFVTVAIKRTYGANFRARVVSEVKAQTGKALSYDTVEKIVRQIEGVIARDLAQHPIIVAARELEGEEDGYTPQDNAQAVIDADRADYLAMGLDANGDAIKPT